MEMMIQIERVNFEVFDILFCIELHRHTLVGTREENGPSSLGVIVYYLFFKDFRKPYMKRKKGNKKNERTLFRRLAHS